MSTKAKLSDDASQKGWKAVFYLWHLAQMNVLRQVPMGPVVAGEDKDMASTPAAASDAGATEPAFSYETRHWDWKKPLPATVAIIDSGCAKDHPNLPVTAIHGAIDLSVLPRGVVYRGESATSVNAIRQECLTRIRDVLAHVADQAVRDELHELAKDLSTKEPDALDLANPGDRFSGHGTACAGLVAGRYLRSTEKKRSVLPYFGVNPFATIVPIATPYSHEIRPLIVALLHAVGANADVVLLPRAVNNLSPDLAPEGEEPATPPGSDLRATAFDTDKQLQRDKVLFEALLGAVSVWRPVVLASGNEGRDEPSYPASLVNETSTGQLIVVGAANRYQLRSSYSSGMRSTGVTTYAPSDDEERIDVTGQWYDPHGWDGPWVKQSLAGKSEDFPEKEYSPYSVLSIDVPARTMPETDLSGDPADLPIRALYSRFGGTSAAASLVAGAVSLLQAKRREAGKAPLSGAQAKDLLQKRPLHKAEEPAGTEVAIIDMDELLTAVEAIA